MERLTALWAFNEAAFGGILHGLHLPVTGLFIGGLSVIIISLIGYYSSTRKTLIKSMLIAATVKFIVAPYTPINAYFALFIQGGLGSLLFASSVGYKKAAFSLAVITLLISSLQRIIIYTVVFGLTLWDSINLFYDFVIKQLYLQNTFLGELNFSWFIVLFYIFLHLIAGILIGVFSARLPEKLEKVHREQFTIGKENIQLNSQIKKGKKRKSFARKPSVLIILFISIVMIIISYIFPEADKKSGEKILIMLVRFISILIIWYFLFLPIITRFLKKQLGKTKVKYGKEIENIISEFPSIKNIVFKSWKMAKEDKTIRKTGNFFFYIIAFIIFSGIDGEER